MDVKIEASWKKILSSEWDSEYFRVLTDFVRNEYYSHRVFPPAAKIFAAFNACPVDKLKVVILGQDPYHGFGQANGLCFSVEDGVRFPPSLMNIFREVSNDTGTPIPTSGNLLRWAEQGVLLMNATLTVRENLAGSHQGHGWEQFTDNVIRTISLNCNNIVFILWGSYAIRKRELIDSSRHLILTSVHPSPLSAHRGFFGNHHFSLANDYLEKHGKERISW